MPLYSQNFINGDENYMRHLYMEDGSVNPALFDKKIIIYGCGNDGRKLYKKLMESEKNIEYFCDSNKNIVL